jgi:serine protease inhibitor
MRPKDEFNLVFDRPFITTIMDETNGAILFLGIVGEP